jgi:hypothetical protein
VDKKHFEALGKGDMYAHIPNGHNKTTKVLVKDVLHTPTLGVTLLSVRCITQAGYALHFRQNDCWIFDARNHCIGTVPLVHGLYRVQVADSTPQANLAKEGPLIATPEELHKLVGHLPIDAAKKLIKKLVDGIELDETASTPMDSCKSCLHGRMTRAKPF